MKNYLRHFPWMIFGFVPLVGILPIFIVKEEYVNRVLPEKVIGWLLLVQLLSILAVMCFIGYMWVWSIPFQAMGVYLLIRWLNKQ